MAAFLWICAVVFALGYASIYVQLAEHLPSRAMDSVMLPLLSLGAFTLIVLIALGFLAFRLDRIEQALTQRTTR